MLVRMLSGKVVTLFCALILVALGQSNTNAQVDWGRVLDLSPKNTETKPERPSLDKELELGRQLREQNDRERARLEGRGTNQGAAVNAPNIQTRGVFERDRPDRSNDTDRQYSRGNQTSPQGGGVSARGNTRIAGQVLRNSWEGLFDDQQGPQNVGLMIISRGERMLYLQNGDRILLPANEVWSGNARVSVDRIFDMPLHYRVMITTRQERPLSDTINELVKTNGQAWAVRNGLMTAREVVSSRGWGLVWEAIKPQPLNSGEAEHVYWRISSAYHGLVDVHVVNEKN